MTTPDANELPAAPFLILSPGDPGYPEALERAKAVFTGKIPGWRLSDCDYTPPTP